MKLSKGGKVGFAVLAIALVALVADRLFLSPGSGGGGPALVSAAVGAPVATTLADDPIGITQPNDRRKLAERLSALAESQEIADAPNAFGLPESWMADLKPTQGPDAGMTPAETFARDHQLQAVVVTGQSDSAFVDGVCLSVGQAVDGFKLVAVTENSATFQADGEQAVLKMNRIFEN